MNNKKIIANWKMKLSIKESIDLAQDYKAKLKESDNVIVCPDYVSLLEVKKKLKGSKVSLGALDCFWEQQGSFTGEISPSVLTEAGCKYVILGHSERRKYLLENYAMIHQKVKAVINTDNIIPIICIGEQIEDRRKGRTEYVLLNQLQEALGGVRLMKNQEIMIAYEPVWAISSSDIGKAIEPADAEQANKIIKLALNDILKPATVSSNISIIYGGSITSKNVKDFLAIDNIDGFLVGGASLDASEFSKIVKIVNK